MSAVAQVSVRAHSVLSSANWDQRVTFFIRKKRALVIVRALGSP